MAATSFGHLTTDDIFPPPGGYKPITGTIFDLLNKYGISWGDYFQDAPQAASFYSSDPHFRPLADFLAPGRRDSRSGPAASGIVC
jgi:hypothetical protein